jgi:hypothetical protein
VAMPLRVIPPIDWRRSATCFSAGTTCNRGAEFMPAAELDLSMGTAGPDSASSVQHVLPIYSQNCRRRVRTASKNCRGNIEEGGLE